MKFGIWSLFFLNSIFTLLPLINLFKILIIYIPRTFAKVQSFGTQ